MVLVSVREQERDALRQELIRFRTYLAERRERSSRPEADSAGVSAFDEVMTRWKEIDALADKLGFTPKEVTEIMNEVGVSQPTKTG